jgi:hypothetical protein
MFNLLAAAILVLIGFLGGYFAGLHSYRDIEDELEED